MSNIRNVKLELLRPGPAHNQLLSPLTPYIALCGAAGPVTINLPFEHRQLLSRLERLRYATATGEVPLEQRQFEAHDIGEALGRVLGQIPSLAPEIGKARGEDQGLVHLRLSVSAFELALVPFELAISPEGFPASGSPLFLQSRAPITITREVRRGQPLNVQWNRKPRILFAFAQPGNLPEVPAVEHLNALRRAIDPWVKWDPDPAKQLTSVKTMLTVPPDASLEGIRDECISTEYTHIHILAHGAPLSKGEQRFGLALCNARDRGAINLVDGETLAIALTGGADAAGAARKPPTLVSLATCDSAQVGSVLTPGGSIAHELNGAGIPWVVASQFPLWMRASTIAVDLLYAKLLKGDDPRWVLYELRQRLRTDSAATHDWASIVAYTTVPWNFEQDVGAFRDRQIRSALEVKFDRAEKLAGGENVEQQTLDDLYLAIRQSLTSWCAELPTATPGIDRSERLGLAAASEKRIGIQYAIQKEEEKARKAYEQSRNLYRQALEAHPVNHWVITQHLSLLAVLAKPDAYGTLANEYGTAWTTARQIARWELRGVTGEKAAWALGTLAELELLGAIYAGAQFDSAQSLQQIRAMCQQLVDVVGADAFAVFSTRRQFQRYLDHWRIDGWNNLAEAAVKCLAEGSSWAGRPYLPGVAT